eukprot:271044-Hanusia_phi.AAC.3
MFVSETHTNFWLGLNAKTHRTGIVDLTPGQVDEDPVIVAQAVSEGLLFRLKVACDLRPELGSTSTSNLTTRHSLQVFLKPIREGLEQATGDRRKSAGGEGPGKSNLALSTRRHLMKLKNELYLLLKFLSLAVTAQ